MNISLHIEAKNPDELKEAIAGLAGITGGGVPSQPEKPKTSKNQPRTKVEEQPNHKPEELEEPAQPAQQDEPTDNSAEEVIPTVVELRAAAQEKGKTPEGKKSIKALLDKFECKSISNVPEEVRAAFMQELEALKV